MHVYIVVIAGWLDDVGLPQYKDTFTEARIDGRMLHCMTVVSVVSFIITYIDRISYFSRTAVFIFSL